jgi:biopolymer transport protein ExbD
LTPIELDVRADGKVDFQGGTLTLDELKPKLEDIAKSTPNQPLIVKKKEKLEKGQLKKVVQLCRDAKLTKITIDKTTPPVAPAPAPAPAAVVAPPDNSPAPANNPSSSPPPAPPGKPLPPAMLLPMNLDLRPDGKIDFQGETFTLDDLKIKLEEMGLTSPTQPIVVVPQPRTPRSEVKKVVALCLSSKLTEVSIAKVYPATAPALANGASSAKPMAASSSGDFNASSASSAPSSSYLLSSSATLASMPATNEISNPPHLTKMRTSHVSALAAPISSGPNYTVP